MANSLVSITRVGSSVGRAAVHAAVRRAMELANWQSAIPRGAEVALKPNLGWDLLLPGSTTSPWVLEGVAEVLKGWAGTIYVVESNQVVVDVEAALRVSRIDRVCRDYGLQWVNMTDMRLVECDLPNGRILKKVLVPELLLRTKLVTVPVMKTHNKTTITGAIKNQWGCLPMFRHNYHLVLDAALADINSVARPIFAVMDATVCLEGDSPKSGIPRVVDRILASADAVALDAVAAKLMSFDPAAIGHLQECVAAGLGTNDLRQIKVCGDDGLDLDLKFIPAAHNLVSRFEMLLRKRAFLRPLFFDTPLFALCCKLTMVYYDVWYSVLGVGRRRCAAILDHTPYGQQWRSSE